MQRRLNKEFAISAIKCQNNLEHTINSPGLQYFCNECTLSFKTLGTLNSDCTCCRLVCQAEMLHTHISIFYYVVLVSAQRNLLLLNRSYLEDHIIIINQQDNWPAEMLDPPY